MNQCIEDKGNTEHTSPLFFSVISALFHDQVLSSFEKKQVFYFGCYPGDGNCLSRILLKAKWGGLEPEGNLEEADENLSLKFENTVLEEADNSWALFISSFLNKASFGVSETKSTELKKTRPLMRLGPSFFKELNLTWKKMRGIGRTQLQVLNLLKMSGINLPCLFM